MASRTEKLSDAQKRSIEWIKRGSAAELGALGTEIGRMLAELTAELADAKSEASHWHAAFEAVSSELKVLVAVALRQLKKQQLLITRNELKEIPPNTELYIGKPEDGVRIYELRKSDSIKKAVRGALQ